MINVSPAPGDADEGEEANKKDPTRDIKEFFSDIHHNRRGKAVRTCRSCKSVFTFFLHTSTLYNELCSSPRLGRDLGRASTALMPPHFAAIYRVNIRYVLYYSDFIVGCHAHSNIGGVLRVLQADCVRTHAASGHRSSEEGCQSFDCRANHA